MDNNSKNLRILLVEDNPGDVDLIREMLSAKGAVNFSIVPVERLSKALSRLRSNDFDLVLLDLGLPDSTGLDTFYKLQSEATDVPIIILSGNTDQSAALTAVREGAQDFLLKGQIGGGLIGRSIHYALERKRAEEARRKSEIKYQDLFNTTLDGIFQVNAEGVFTLMNPAGARIFGHENPDELIGRNALAYWRDPAEREAYRKELATHKKISSYPMRAKKRNGDPVELESSSRVMEDEQGRLLGIEGILRDVTARKRVEDALRLSEEKYRHLVENLGKQYVFYRHDTHGHFTYISPSATDMLGYSERELLAHYSEYLTDNPVNREAERNTNLSIQGIQQPPYEVEIRHKDGSTRWLEVSEYPVRDENGNVIAVEGIARDVTERKYMEAGQQASLRFLQIVHNHKETGPLFEELVSEIKNYTGCDSVGIRVLDDEGNIPYQVCKGFSAKFFETESPLSIESDECMCVNVIKGTTDPRLPYYTEGGSFYMNGTTRFLATVSEEEKGKTRNVCNREGYESVALVPFRSGGRILGLIHVADRRDNMVPLKMVELLESTAMQLGTAFQRVHAEEALRKSEARFRHLFENMLEGLAYCRMIYDGNKPNDFIYLSVNNAFETLTGLKHVIGKRASEVIPGIRESDPGLLEIYGRVALTGKSESFEMYVKALQMWFAISVYSPEHECFVAVFDVITERKRSEQALRSSEEFIRSILSSIDEAFVVIDPEYRIISANAAYGRHAGMPLEDIIGKPCYEVSHHLSSPCNEPEMECPLRKTFETGEPAIAYHTHTGGTGNLIHVETKTYAMKDAFGKVQSVIEIINDISERKKLEDQLRHAQKMEGIGTLAGGIAHDFNNILSAIIGYGHVTLMKMAQDDPLRMNVESMLESADRAAALTQNLLTFSRKQVINRKPVDMNEILRKVEKFLTRVIGEDVEVRMTFKESACTINADAGQLEQVFMNLATNARDAMPSGGMLEIDTAVTELDNGFVAAHGYGKPGCYCMIAVTDTGMGMDEETRKKIFEPFFTTKAVGKGTGLGLPMVYGIIKQHDGFINVYSEPAKGTTFRIYLPLIKMEKTDTGLSMAVNLPKGGTETILLAEDDEHLRVLNELVLKQMGYRIITARDGVEAVEKYREHKDSIQLLLFDLIMPRMNGKEACDEIRKITPGIPVIFASGYSPDLLQQKALIEKGSDLITKPMSPTLLLEKVRGVLDGKLS